MKEKNSRLGSIWNFLRKWSGEILLLAIAALLIHLWQTRGTATGEAPELSGRLLDGSEYTLEQTADSPRLVHFWATWCPVCRLEMETINELSKSSSVITVALKSGDNRDIADYLKQNDLQFPVISDPLGQLADRWGVQGVPSSFILDEEGLIRFVEVGYTTSLGLRLRLWWSEISD